MSRALLGLLLLGYPVVYWTGKASGGVLVVISPCEPVQKPVVKWKKTVRV